jgi:acyl carrier protein
LNSDEVRQRLVGWLKQLLHTTSVKSDDNLFALGAQSLTAMRLIGRIEAEYGVRLSLRDVFQNPSVELLTERIRCVPREPRIRRARRATQSSRPYEAPITLAQESFWRIARAIPEAPLHIQVVQLEALGEIDGESLLAALQDTVARHDALRATFCQRGDQVFQVITPVFSLPVTSHEFSGLGPEQRRDALRELVRGELRRPFDLTREVPIRVRHVRFCPTDCVLLLSLHHIAFDGWSRQVLMSDIAAFYKARVDGTATRPAPPLRYSDVADWEARRHAEGAFNRSLEFWRDQFAGVCADLRLPGAATLTGYRTIAHAIALPEAELRQIRASATNEGVTLSAMLMATFMGLVSSLASADESRAALQVANRERYETQDVIGLFANVAVVRVAYHEGVPFRDFLRSVQARNFEVLEHQAVPFEHVIAELGKTGQLDPARLLQIGFTLNESARVSVDVPGGRLQYTTPHRDHAGKQEVDPTNFSLLLELRPVEDGIAGYIKYQNDVYPTAVIESFSRRYLSALRTASNDPGDTVGAIFHSDR